LVIEGIYEGVVGNLGAFGAGGNKTGGADLLGIKDARWVRDAK